MKAKAIAIGIAVSALTFTGAHAAVISSDEITDANPSNYDPFDLTLVHDPNITALGIGRGDEITAKTTTDRYNAISWTTAKDLGANDFYYFKLDAKEGFKISFTSFVYDSYASGTGPTAFAFRSSLDGFTTDIGSPTATGTTIDLSDSKYQNLEDLIEFRLYGYSAEGGTGSFGINEYSFNGTVTAVPEPETAALVGIGSLLMLAHVRGKRKKKNAYPLS